MSLLMIPMLFSLVVVAVAAEPAFIRHDVRLAQGGEAYMTNPAGSRENAVIQCSKSGGSLVSMPTLQKLWAASPTFIKTLKTMYPFAAGASELWIGGDVQNDNAPTLLLAADNSIVTSAKPSTSVNLFGICYGGTIPGYVVGLTKPDDSPLQSNNVAANAVVPNTVGSATGETTVINAIGATPASNTVTQ